MNRLPTKPEFLALSWFIPIVLAGGLVPILLTSALLAGLSEPASSVGWSNALDHGELFLAAGNAAVTSGVLLVVSRPDIQLRAVILALISLLLLAVPSYAMWAAFTTLSLLDKNYSTDFAKWGGLAAASLCGITSLILCERSAPTDNRIE